MKKIISRVMIAAIASVILLGTSAFAGINFIDYNVMIGKFNGSGYTAYQTKTTTGMDGYIISVNVGGDYVVDARMDSPSGNGSWARDITDNQTRMLPGTSKQKRGCSVRAKFSNDLTTPVAVQVRGQFMSN